MDESVVERGLALGDWIIRYKKGTDFDLWGQPLEAIDVYTKLAKRLRISSSAEDELFTDEHKKVIGKIASSLELRCKVLDKPGRVETVTLEDLKAIEEVLTALCSNKVKDFPLPVSSIPKQPCPPIIIENGSQPPLPILQEDEKLSDEDKEEADLIEKSKSQGSLLPPPALIPGQRILSIRVENIALRDATQYIDPFITISVRDINGELLASSQDTPFAIHKEDQKIVFSADAYIQKTLETLPSDYAIFFEFKHYKPKKRKVSTKCWSILEPDEVKEGTAAIEIYKKPTNMKRRHMSLLSKRPLYLHLKLTFLS